MSLFIKENMEKDPPFTSKIDYTWLADVEINQIFRYKKSFYKRISKGRALNQDFMEPLDINSSNYIDAVAILMDLKEDKKEEVKNDTGRWSAWEE